MWVVHKLFGLWIASTMYVENLMDYFLAYGVLFSYIVDALSPKPFGTTHSEIGDWIIPPYVCKILYA